MSLQFGSNSFYQKLLNETRPRKPAPPPLDKLATPQKNTLCSFHFARAGFLFLLMKRVFFCGVLPSKYSGRWRGWPHFDLAREKRNSPQTLPFCPPAWASPPKLLDGRVFRRRHYSRTNRIYLCFVLLILLILQAKVNYHAPCEPFDDNLNIVE